MFVSTMLRVARPTDNLERITQFYRDGLGLAVLYQFEDHDGFDGVMLGLPGAPYHFEFTQARGHHAGRAPTEDNLLVFYFRMNCSGILQWLALGNPGMSRSRLSIRFGNDAD